MDARYRVVLTGELLPGHELESAAQALAALLKLPPEKARALFGKRPMPLNKVLDYRAAHDIEQRLRAVGVGCRVEALERQAPASFTARDLDNPPPQSAPAGATVTCPKCGKVQPAAEQCGGCGIVFAKYHPAAEPHPAEAPPALSLVPHAEADGAGRDMDELYGLYVGNRAERYLRRFAPMRASGNYTPGWNWAAFFFSAAWAAYRKMWLWVPVAIGINLLALLVPWLGALLHVAFTVSADYLYFRQVRAKVDPLALEAEPEAPIALAGGTSWLAVAGVMVASGLAMGVVAKSLMPFSMAELSEVQQTVAGDPQIAALAGTTEGMVTQAAFQTAALATHAWRRSGNDLALLSVDRLILDAKASEAQLTDGWGRVLVARPDPEGFLLISAGPDRAMDTDDDIPILFAARPPE